jgi:two-component system chemotaxis response regulator CheB
MPKEAIARGAAEKVVPLGAIARELLEAASR